MKHNFKHTQMNREGRSSKWNAMYNMDPNAQFIPLTVADMEFETAPEIVEALNHYTQVHPLGYSNANASYYEAVLNWFKNTQNLTLTRQELYLTNGVISALHGLIEVLTKPGDSILITSPVYSHFFSTPTDMGREVLDVPLIYKDGYTMDYEALNTTLETTPCKVMILCNPHNPIGKVWSRTELETLYAITKKHNVLVIADEIHADIIMESHTFTSFRHIDETCILCTSPSKTFNLAGLQLANIFIPQEEIYNALVARNKYAGIHDPNALSYIATEAAYKKGMGWLQECLGVINQNYLLIKEGLTSSPYKVLPLEGTYLLWIDYSQLKVEEAHFMKLLMHHDLYVSAGSAYGTSGLGFIRINLALPTSYIPKIINILLKVVEEL